MSVFLFLDETKWICHATFWLRALFARYHISTHSWEPTLLIGWNLAESKQCCRTKVNYIINVIACAVLGMAVSGLMLRLKAKELANDPEFKASLGWYRNWKRHHSLSLRTKTTLAQRLPDDLENKILQFYRFVIAARQRMQYPLAKIFNMDETPMQFELPSSPLLLQSQ